MASPAPLKALDVGVGLKTGFRHGIHGDPGHGVFAVRILVMLVFVTLTAGFFRRQLDVGHIVLGLVPIPVTGGAVETGFAHFTA
jgi:hypothetical protein